MLAAIDFDVLRLRRTRIGPLVLGDLQLGHHRNLSPREKDALRGSVGLGA
jgi:16S rRNA U516 pseudouridylate synthase RsuA-like enzyme